MLSRFYAEDHIKRASMEDIGFGDITTENLAGNEENLKAELNTRSDGVLCGCEQAQPSRIRHVCDEAQGRPCR